MRGRVALLILLTWVLMALAGRLLPLAPDAVALDRLLVAPNAGDWLGTDELGRPVLDRVLSGAATSLGVAASVVTLSALLGITLGVLGAARRGWLDMLLVLVMDMLLAFPGLLLAIALAGVLGPGPGNVVIALLAVGWVSYARLARAQVLSLMQADHVAAARALGVGFPRIAVRHLLPLMAAPLLVEATFGAAGVIVAEAGLSFLGLGVQPPDASWGSMIREGVRYMMVAPHLVLAPGALLFLVVVAINISGDALRDRLDARLETRNDHEVKSV
jgi:peptide/nickel transport system permease protein